MRYVLRLLKNAVAFLLFYSGLLSVIASVRLKNRAVVLMYHRVIPENRRPYCHSSPGIIVQESTFRMHLALLRDHFRILSLDEFLQHMDCGMAFPRKSCLITFDDGWVDNYQTAYPILREHGVPAAIFLPFDYIGTERLFWQEELSMRLSLLLPSRNESDRQFLEGLMNGENVPTSEQLLRYIQELKNSGYGTIMTVLERVRNYQDVDSMPDHDDRYIDWRQASEMGRHGVSFGSHCMSHRILTKLSAKEKRTEIIQSKLHLERALKCRIDSVAYPNGDFDEEVITLSSEAGYKLGFSTKRGFVSSRTHALSVPRINIHEHATQSKAMLMCKILGVF